MVVLFGLHALSLRINSVIGLVKMCYNVLYKCCFVMFQKLENKLTFFKLVNSNSLTTVEKN